MGQQPLLTLLPPDSQQLLRGYLKSFVAEVGTVLYEPESAAEYVYFANSGMISLVTVLKDGATVESATTGNEGVVGASAALGQGVHSQQAIVQLKFSGHRMSAHDFRLLYHGNEAFRALVNRAQELLVSQYQQSAACNAVHHVEARMARWLLLSLERVSDNGPLTLTQEFLAQMLGVRRTSVTEVATKLQQEGLIAYTRGKISVVDRGGLERRSCECFETFRKRRLQILGY